MSLVIIVPKADREAVRAALQTAGYGPDNVSVPMRGTSPVDASEATHYGSHWYEGTAELEFIRSIRETVLQNAIVVTDKVDPVIDTEPAVGSDLFQSAVGDSIVMRHKQFSSVWGWRAEMSVRSASFDPGVRAVAVYSNSTHTAFLYTTGAFTWDDVNKVWATEWNENKAQKTDVYWAMLFASVQEQKGTLAAADTSSTLYMRFGYTAPTTTQPWVQPTGAHDAYPLGARVTHNGQTWESTVANNVWAPGVFGWVVV
jgi:hypothetical protein